MGQLSEGGLLALREPEATGEQSCSGHLITPDNVCGAREGIVADSQAILNLVSDLVIFGIKYCIILLKS